VIHRASRHRLALALRRYAAKRATNDELDRVDVDWRDRGAVAVKEMAWRLYDDTYTHRASGRHAFSRELRRTVARWVVFLHSDEEYLWPEYSFIQVSPGIGSLITLGWWGRRAARRWQEFTEAGQFECWPFISQEQERSAIAKPRLLARGDA
jgi:hypothetical protein